MMDFNGKKTCVHVRATALHEHGNFVFKMPRQMAVQIPMKLTWTKGMFTLVMRLNKPNMDYAIVSGKHLNTVFAVANYMLINYAK